MLLTEEKTFTGLLKDMKIGEKLYENSEGS